MSFNTDLKNKHRKSFSQISKAISQRPLDFNNINGIQATSQKHLGTIFNTRLSFEKHLEIVLCKINKTIGLICKLQNLLPKSALITLYKASVPPHLDFGHIFYNQALNASFHQ